MRERERERDLVTVTGPGCHMLTLLMSTIAAESKDKHWSYFAGAGGEEFLWLMVTSGPA